MNEQSISKESERMVKHTEERSKKDEETMSRFRNTLSKLKSLLKVVTYLGIKTKDERGKETINSAVQSGKDGDLQKAVDSLEESCDFLIEKIDETVEREIKKMKSIEGMNENDSGHRQIKRAISKLEKAKDNKEFEDLPDLLFEAWDKVKKK
ncbi:MAG: hypothetical protein ACOCTN_03260 [Candidatus Natronoplasma sp.]